MDIYIKKLKDITSEEEASFSKLHYSRGVMWPKYEEYQHPSVPYYQKKQCKVIYIKDKNKIIGWLLLYPAFDDNMKSLHVFVNPEYRKQGIGRKLIKKAIQSTRCKLEVYPHHVTSDAFYREISETSKRIQLNYENSY